MRLLVSLVIILYSLSAYAATTKGTVSVEICDPPAQLIQTDSGVQQSGAIASYCDTDPSGNVTCYF